VDRLTSRLKHFGEPVQLEPVAAPAA